MPKIKRVEEFNETTYITISVILVFGPNSIYSKFSDNYNDGHRHELARTIKKDSKRKINTLFEKDAKPTYNWIDSEPHHLEVYPSIMEVCGFGIVEKNANVGVKELGKISKELNYEFSDKFGKGTSCMVNIYTIKNGKVADTSVLHKN